MTSLIQLLPVRGAEVHWGLGAHLEAAWYVHSKALGSTSNMSITMLLSCSPVLPLSAYGPTTQEKVKEAISSYIIMACLIPLEVWVVS